MASPANEKRLQDANVYSGGYSATAVDYQDLACGGMVKALPNAAANNTTDYIDTYQAGNAALQATWLIIDVPALSDHTDSSKTNLFTLLHSTSTTVTAAYSPLIEAQLVGVTSTGSAATQYKIRIPPGCNRYIAVKQTVPSGGGTGSNANVTYRLVF
jgi:hypothetical protein